MPTGSTTSNPSRERDGVGRDLTKSGSEFREDVIGAKMYKRGSMCVHASCIVCTFDCDIVFLMGSESLQITIPGKTWTVLPFELLTDLVVQTWTRMTSRRRQFRLDVPAVHLDLAVDQSHRQSSPQRRQ